MSRIEKWTSSIKIFSILSLGLGLYSVPSVTHAQTWHDRGNGGDVIVCPGVGGTSLKVTFFDVHETEFRYELKPVFPEVADVDQKVEALIRRLDRINPTRAKLYRSWYSDFWKDMNLVSGEVLEDVSDAGTIDYPKDCKLEQLIIQRYPELSNGSRYTVNKDLWELMDDDNRAVAVLHELILREARLTENGHGTSESTRHLNAFIISDRVEQMTLQEFLEFLRELNFAQGDANGFSIALCLNKPIEFYSPHQVKSASLHDRARWTLQGRVYEADVTSMMGRGGCGRLPLGSEVSFYKNGQVRFFAFALMLRPGHFLVHVDQDGIKGEVPAHRVEFEPSGRVSSLSAFESQMTGYLETTVFKTRLEPSSVYRIRFSSVKNEVWMDGLECPLASVRKGSQWLPVFGKIVLDKKGAVRQYRLCN